MPAWLYNLYRVVPVWPFAVALLVVAVLLLCRRWRWALVSLIAVLSGTGAFLAMGYGEDDRSLSRFRYNLATVRGQMERLKALLLDYRARHGRFPTSEEGLGVLDGFQAVLPGKMHLAPYSPAGAPAELRAVVSPLALPDRYARSMALHEYRTDHGRFPQNEQELTVALAAWRGWDYGHTKGWEPVDVRFAMAADGELFILAPGGVLSPGHLPYLYENRTGLPTGVVRGPLADLGSDGRFTVRVAEGISLFSAEAWDSAGELDRGWWAINIPCLVGAGMVAAAVLLLIPLARMRGLKAGLVAMVLSVLLGVALTRLFEPDCAVVALAPFRRTSAMVARQKDLLREYRLAGAISDAAYQRAMAAIRVHENVPQPATAPVSAPAPVTRPGGE